MENVEGQKEVKAMTIEELTNGYFELKNHAIKMTNVVDRAIISLEALLNILNKNKTINIADIQTEANAIINKIKEVKEDIAKNDK